MDWISVEDELPEEYKYVLVDRKYDVPCTANYSRPRGKDFIRWFHVNGYGISEPVTHWMPLPESNHN